MIIIRYVSLHLTDYKTSTVLLQSHVIVVTVMYYVDTVIYCANTVVLLFEFIIYLIVNKTINKGSFSLILNNKIKQNYDHTCSRQSLNITYHILNYFLIHTWIRVICRSGCRNKWWCFQYAHIKINHVITTPVYAYVVDFIKFFTVFL